MSTEERLEALVEGLRRTPRGLDELTRARVGAKLEAALAAGGGAPVVRRRWGRAGVVAGAIGAVAAAAAVIVIGVRATGTGSETAVTASAPIARGTPVAEARPARPAPASPASASSSPATASSSPATAPASPATASASPANAPASPATAPASPASAPASPATDAAARLAVRAPALPRLAPAPPPPAPAVREVEQPVAVAAGESVQLSVGGAAVTVYGPGRLAPASGGADVEAAGIVVDRTRGETPWTVRYHGVEVVTTRATFAMDHGTEARVTVMRGEVVLRCPSGERTLGSGEQGTCAVAKPAAEPPYATAETAMRKGDGDAARDALHAVIAADPDSLDAATALLDLARLAAARKDTAAARVYLERLARHPRKNTLDAPAAKLRRGLDRQ